ncbi:vacuolar-sorting protein SNF7 [Mycena floridula]|nr:vacuolar-sorting protein SNF7 [Mycena floridula]
MDSMMSYFTRRAPDEAAKEAIVALRVQAQILIKKEAYLQTKVEEHMKTARSNAISNKPAATAALKLKKMVDAEMKQTSDIRLQLEMQIFTLESANINRETMLAMQKAADALKAVLGSKSVADADKIMADVQNGNAVANEIAAIIAEPYADNTMDDEELLEELKELEREQFNERIKGAQSPPLFAPPSTQELDPQRTTGEEEEEVLLRQLQAEMAM